ncbi:molybdenum cofactor guanylyltransferase MobA [soil metagenome]
MKLCGCILAGGKSSRMGTPKEGVLMPDGRAMIEHAAAALRPLVDVLLVVGNSAGFDPAQIGATRIDDLRSDCGPLAAIEAALNSGIGEHYLIVTCDQPRLTTDLLRLFTSPNVIGKATALRDLGPFPCHLSATLGAEVTRALDKGERSPRRFLQLCGARWITAYPGAEALVASVNTPDELHK